MAGKASVVTDEIDTFTETGLRLRSGEELPADIIVSATGRVIIWRLPQSLVHDHRYLWVEGFGYDSGHIYRC